MNVYTCNYRNFIKLANGSDIIPVAISNSVPTWFADKVAMKFRNRVFYLPELYPGWDLLNEYTSGDITEFEYTEKYNKNVLSKITPDEIMNKLKAISESNNDKDIAILCWCKDFCHRHLVASFCAPNYIFNEL